MTTAEAIAIIEEQAAIIEHLSHDAAFDILTRSGLEHLCWPKIVKEASYIIFIDIDHMHELNERLGYEKVNEIIRASIHGRDVVKKERRALDIGRWFSGDEIVIIIRDGDPVKYAKSLLREMHRNGISGTFGIATVTSDDLAINVRAAMDLVQCAKMNDRRGTINQIDL